MKLSSRGFIKILSHELFHLQNSGQTLPAGFAQKNRGGQKLRTTTVHMNTLAFYTKCVSFTDLDAIAAEVLD